MSYWNTKRSINWTRDSLQIDLQNVRLVAPYNYRFLPRLVHNAHVDTSRQNLRTTYAVIVYFEILTFIAAIANITPSIGRYSDDQIAAFHLTGFAWGMEGGDSVQGRGKLPRIMADGCAYMRWVGFIDGALHWHKSSTIDGHLTSLRQYPLTVRLLCLYICVCVWHKDAFGSFDSAYII